MSTINPSHPMRTPWWEHTTTSKPCEEQPTTTSTPASTSTTTSTTAVPETTTTQTPATSTTVELEQPTTTLEVPTPQHRFELTPAGTPGPNGHPPQVEQPNPIHVAVSTPLPVVDAVTVELAPPVSYAAPTLPHTGSETAVTAGVGGLLVAVGLICTALAARTRKANR